MKLWRYKPAERLRFIAEVSTHCLKQKSYFKVVSASPYFALSIWDGFSMKTYAHTLTLPSMR